MQDKDLKIAWVKIPKLRLILQTYHKMASAKQQYDLCWRTPASGSAGPGGTKMDARGRQKCCRKIEYLSALMLIAEKPNEYLQHYLSLE